MNGFSSDGRMESLIDDELECETFGSKVMDWLVGVWVRSDIEQPSMIDARKDVEWDEESDLHIDEEEEERVEGDRAGLAEPLVERALDKGVDRAGGEEEDSHAEAEVG